MVCRNLEDVYELYLLGTLDGPESREISEHLARGCPNCIHQLRDATLTIYLLGQTVKPTRLNPKSKSQLLQRLKKR